MNATTPFRSKFIYNNNLYSLGGYVAEKLAGSSYEKLVKDKLFTPLGMTSSGFIDHVTDNMRRDIATPYSSLNGSILPINITTHR